MFHELYCYCVKHLCSKQARCLGLQQKGFAVEEWGSFHKFGTERIVKWHCPILKHDHKGMKQNQMKAKANQPSFFNYLTNQ